MIPLFVPFIILALMLVLAILLGLSMLSFVISIYVTVYVCVFMESRQCSSRYIYNRESKNKNNHIELIKSANPYLIFATIFVFIIGLYYSLFFISSRLYSRTDENYVYSCSFCMVCSMTYSTSWFMRSLVYNPKPLFNVVARSYCSSRNGFYFNVIDKWKYMGKPTWGVWWVWDARLTSMLILFFFTSLISFFGRLYQIRSLLQKYQQTSNNRFYQYTNN